MTTDPPAIIAHILAAYDGSASAEHAFTYALDLAHRYGARLTVLSIIQPPEFPIEMALTTLSSDAELRFQALFAKLRQKAAARAITATFEIAVGHPAQQIVERSKQDRIDLVVVGHRGKSLVERLLVGSVSRHVISHASCPVLVVR